MKNVRNHPDRFSYQNLQGLHLQLRGLFQKFPASYIKKRNTTRVTSLFFHIIPVNFNALVPSFLQLLYAILVEEFILPLKKDLHKRNDVIVTRKMCATEVFFSAVGTNRSRRVLDLENMVDEVIIHSHIQPQQMQQRRCGQARYHAAEELNVTTFLDAFFSLLRVIYVVHQHNIRL